MIAKNTGNFDESQPFPGGNAANKSNGLINKHPFSSNPSSSPVKSLREPDSQGPIPSASEELAGIADWN